MASEDLGSGFNGTNTGGTEGGDLKVGFTAVPPASGDADEIKLLEYGGTGDLKVINLVGFVCVLTLKNQAYYCSYGFIFPMNSYKIQVCRKLAGSQRPNWTTPPFFLNRMGGVHKIY